MKVSIPVIENLLVYKNGIVVVVKRLRLDSTKSYIIVSKPVNVVKGSFWVYHKEKRVEEVINRVEIIENKEPKTFKKEDCTNYQQILKSNIGKKVKIVRTAVGEKVVNVGKIINVVGNFVHLEGNSEEKCAVFETSGIYGIFGIDCTLELSYTKEEPEKIEQRIGISYNVKESTDVYISYLMAKEQLIWEPSYKLHLDTKSKKGNMKMHGILLNNSEEDLNVLNFIFAGGNPKLKFVDKPDSFIGPFKSGPTILRQTGNLFQPQQRRMQMTNVMQQQMQIMPNDPQPVSGSNLPKMSATEYVFYPKKDVVTKKKTRAIIPIFDCDITYTESYQVSLRDQKKPLDVIHYFKVPNNTKLPFTTGPVVISSDKTLINSQSQVYFTGIGSTAEIESDTSLSVNVTYSEKVVKTDKTKRSSSSYYIFVQMIHTGTVKVINFRDVDVDVLFKYDFIGELKESKKLKFIEKTEKSYTNDNNLYNTHMKWKKVVAKGKKFEFQFTFYRWVRQNV